MAACRMTSLSGIDHRTGHAGLPCPEAATHGDRPHGVPLAAPRALGQVAHCGPTLNAISNELLSPAKFHKERALCQGYFPRPRFP